MDFLAVNNHLYIQVTNLKFKSKIFIEIMSISHGNLILMCFPLSAPTTVKPPVEPTIGIDQRFFFNLPQEHCNSLRRLIFVEIY